MISRKIRIGVLLLTLGLIGIGAEWPPDALEAVRHLAIQHNGRVKPFDSFAREVLDQITGQPRIGREDPVKTVLSIAIEPERWQETPLLSIPFVPLREALGLSRKTTHVSYSELVATRKLMRMLPPIVQKQQRDEKLSMLENETMDLYGRFAALNGLFQQEFHSVPPAPGGDTHQGQGIAWQLWLPILKVEGYPEGRKGAFQESWGAFATAVRVGDPKKIQDSARRLSELFRGANPAAYPAPWRLRLEVVYNRVSPLKVARMFYLLAFLTLLFSFRSARPWSSIGMCALWTGFILHAAGILTRVVLAGRPPVSNFYETMLWLPFVGVLISLVFERIYRVRYFGFAAAVLAFITLMLADHLPLDPSLSPVVAVLRSNLWLTIHVLTIVASYGALSLGTVLAHLYGWMYLVRDGRDPALVSLGTFLYRSIQVGVVLLASGIMLGGVWANASWGRYWGWDPKETWALITLLWFLAVLHGRFAGWIQGVGVALSTIGGFFLLLMTYYGVSFYLVGLHSYAGGHAKPLPPLLIAYLAAEVAFMVFVGLRAGFRIRFRRESPGGL